MDSNTADDRDIIERWRGEPAPLLPTLHAFHDRDGYLSDDALKQVSKGLRIPLAELYGTVTFYHHFSRTEGGLQAARVCTGNICCLRGGNELLAALEGQGATAMPCAGRCDIPVPVLREHDVLMGSPQNLVPAPSPLPVANPGSLPECVFADIRAAGRDRIEGYRSTGGYAGLQEAMQQPPGHALGVLAESKLSGRGGAGFPTAAKWQAVADAPGAPKTIVCNADEGEPGCFKDRALMDLDPHAVIEGMTIAAYATGATRGFIYLRYEYPQTMRTLARAIEEATEAGWLGSGIGGDDFDFQIYIRRGAGAYICGEEGSLLNSLEGKRPLPRNRPPFPVTHGFADLPTAVNNVETLASVPQIIRHGAAWYRGLGRGDNTGTKVISLSGDIERAGNYEVPLGLPLNTLLYQWAGGTASGRTVQAVTMAGLSGGFLAGKDLEVDLDEPSIRSRGSFLGAGGIMVFDDRRNMVEMAKNAMAFFAEESCGKCFPCRIGTQRLTERLAGAAGPADRAAWVGEVEAIGSTMMATSACGLGMAAPHVTRSLLKYFPDEVSAHLAG